MNECDIGFSREVYFGIHQAPLKTVEQHKRNIAKGKTEKHGWTQMGNILKRTAFGLSWVIKSMASRLDKGFFCSESSCV